MNIVCCGLAGLTDTIRRHSPSHVVSIGAPASGWDWRQLSYVLDEVTASHLSLTFHDVLAEDAGLRGPSESDVQRLLDYVRLWANPSARPLLIHCQLGVSRSTAATLITLAALNPRADPQAFTVRMREAAPHARPNLRLMAIGDSLLSRNGALIAAAASLHRPYDPSERPFPFVIATDPPH